MKRYYFLVLGFVFFSQCYAKIIDTTIFSSDFEKQLFLHRLNDPTVQNIDWFMALDYEYVCQTFLDRFHKDVFVLQKETKSQRTQKKVKTIYNSVQNEYCKKYQEEGFFNELFTGGNFNSITASAIYSMMFDALDIPNTIKIKANQAYVIANPDQSPFLIEPTPKNETQSFSIEFKSKFIEYLHSSKIIFDQEFNSDNTQTLFEKYFIADRVISLKQLSGILYLNKGIHYINKSNFEEALKNFEKAYLLYPSYFILFMQNNAAINVLNDEQQKNKFVGKSLAIYLNANGANSKAMRIAKDYFNYVTNELVLNHPNIQQYDSYYSEFKQFVDTVSINDFTQIYSFYKAYYLCLNNDFTSALKYLESAYHCNPENLQTRQFVKEVISRLLTYNSNNNYNIENLQALLHSFPFLQNDFDFQRLYLSCIGKSIVDAFEGSQFSIGNELLDSMEIKLKNSNHNALEDEAMVNVYNQLATYYYGRGNYVQAMKILERGMVILPNSDLLKQHYQSFLDFKFGGKKPTTKYKSY